MTIRNTLLLGALGALTIASCSDAETSDRVDLRREMLQSLGDNVILPLYADFETRTAELDARANAFCDAPTEEGLVELRETWWETRTPWKMAEAFDFGPAEEEPIRLGPKIDFWPARTDSIETVLSGDGPLDKASVASLGAANRGLPVIEYLLYVPEDSAESLGVFQGEGGDRRCLYLTSLTGDLQDNAKALREAWDPEYGDYLGELVRAGEDSATYLDIVEAMNEVAGRMESTCETLKKRKMNAPLGIETTVTQPELAESRFSGRAVQDMEDNLRGLEALFTGSYGDNQGMGFHGYMQEVGLNIKPEFDQEMELAITALRNIPGSLGEAVSDDPDSVTKAVAAVSSLQKVIHNDMIKALGLSSSFSDNEGD